MAETGDARLNPRAVPHAADSATAFFPVLLKAQAEVLLVVSYTPEALTEYLRERAKFDWRGGTLFNATACLGGSDRDGGLFQSGAVCAVGQQLAISGSLARVESHYVYQVYAVDQACQKVP